MIVCHISDTHLGYRNFHRIDPDTGINQREQDIYDAFEQTVDQIIESDPGLVVHAGDLFDTVRPTNRAVNVATVQFARLSQAEIPTVVIAGNHDTPKMATTGTIMQSLDQLPDIHAVTSDATQEHGGYRTIKEGNMTVHAVSDAPIEETLRNRLESVEPDQDAEWNILVIHAGVSSVQDEVYSGEFNEHYITNDYLDTTDMDYVALGHYHKRMSIDTDVKAHYSGAIERFSFNESNYQPGYLNVEFEDSVSVEEQTLSTRDFFKIPDIDAQDHSAESLQEEITEQLPDEEDLEGTLLSLTIKNLDPSIESRINENVLNDLRDRMFETQFQLVGPEGDVTTGEDLEFQDLRQEFDKYMNDLEFDDEDDQDEILETGQEYLARAIGEEDQI